jgi:hypothetical protein
LSQSAILLGLGEGILVEAVGVSLKLTCGGTLSQQVGIAVLHLLGGLTARSIEEVGPHWHVATDQPEVVVATNEASIESDSGRDTPQSKEGVNLPAPEGCGLFLTADEIGAVGRTKDRVKLGNLFSRDLTQELSCYNSVNISEAVLELNGIAIAGQEVLEQSAETLSSSVLVDLEMVEVSAGSRIPLKQVA